MSDSNDHKGFTLWMTGLSGSGKSTITDHLIDSFEERQIPLEVLDGDIVRESGSAATSLSQYKHAWLKRACVYFEMVLACTLSVRVF